jgi:uncharacterized delta-60 repeat protein
MSGLEKSGEVEVELLVPFDATLLFVGAGRHADGAMYIAALTADNSSDLTVTVVRLNANNLPDPAYGENGFASVSLPSLSNAHLVLLEEGGVMIVCAGTESPATAYLVKFNSSGQLDPTFGNQGKVIHYFERHTLTDECSDLTGQEQDDRLHEGLNKTKGMVSKASDRLLHYGHMDGFGFLAAFTLDGQLDTEFGDAGIAVLSAPDSSVSILLLGITELSDGKIVAYGRAGRTPSNPLFKGLIAKILSSGQPDVTFGNGGYVLVGNHPDIPNYYRLTYTSVVEGADSSLICSGELIASQSGDPLNYGIIAHLDARGAYAPGFNSGKPVAFGLLGLSNVFLDVTLQDDSKVVAVGYSESPAAPFQVDYLIVRFNADGSRDLGFGMEGFVSGNFGPGDNTANLVLMDRGLITVLVRYHRQSSGENDFLLYLMGFSA